MGWRKPERVTGFSVTRALVHVTLQEESGCKELPPLGRVIADLRALAPRRRALFTAIVDGTGLQA
jgi:hypothetical protein